MTLIIQKPTGAKLNLAQTYVGIDDPDAAVYIAAVEAADGQSLETATKVAIHSFVKGCKADGICPAIKASCILAGARTLAGALVPLAGTAPTNVGGLFVSGDYNRKTGLVGDESTKHLNSNRNNNADPQNSKHLAVYFGAALSSASATGRIHMGVVAASFSQVGASAIFTDQTGATVDSGRYRANGATPAIIASGLATGLKAVSRSSSSEIISRQNTTNATTASTSETPVDANLFVFARNAVAAGSTVDSFSNARLAFYSIGESLNLARLDSRVTDLINAFAAAIP
jgi:hypothetical protein